MHCAVLLWLTAELLVLHKGDSSLGFYTLEGKLIEKIKLKLNPHEMVASPDGRWLYISENGTMRIENISKGGNSVAVVDLKKRKKVRSVSTGEFRRPHGVWLARDLFITAEAPDQVLRMRDNKIVRTYGNVGRITHMVAINPAGTVAYASNSGSGTVSVIDLETGNVETVATGKRPQGFAVSADGREVYVTNRDSNTISVIDTASRKVTQIETGKGPVRVGLTPDQSSLVYALQQGAIGIADAKTRREIAQVPVEGIPVSLHLSPDGKTAYASSELLDTVHIVDVPGRKLIRSFQTQKGYAPDPVMELPSAVK